MEDSVDCQTVICDYWVREDSDTDADADPCAWLTDDAVYMESDDGLYTAQPMQLLCSPQRQAEAKEEPEQVSSKESQAKMKKKPLMWKGVVPPAVHRDQDAAEAPVSEQRRDLINGVAYRAFTLLQVVLLLPTVHRQFLIVQDKGDVAALQFSNSLRGFVRKLRGYIEAVADEYGLRVSKVRLIPHCAL